MLIYPTHGKSFYEVAALGCGLSRRSPAHSQLSRFTLAAARALNIAPKRLYT
jgi:hypothetical protein